MPCGHDESAVVGGKVAELGVELGLIPIGFDDGGFEVVRDEAFGHASEVAEGVFETAQEALGVLGQNGFDIGLARVAEGDQ